jgi:DNA gyrase subunit B
MVDGSEQMKADDWVPADTTHDWAADPQDVAHVSHIRAAPDRFVSALDADGVVHLLLEVLAYVQDEAIAGGAKRARVECLGDRFVVSDDGRGTQMVRNPDTGALLVKPIMASADLRYFGRDDAPLLESGAKRSGISIVNALSAALTHSSLRQGSVAWVQQYERGVPVGPPETLADHPRGTRVQFCPDDEIFGNVSSADVAERLRLRCANFAPLVVTVT